MTSILLLGVLAGSALSWSDLRAELDKTWPANREIRIVCHGHSVPAGYFATPKVETFSSYPHLLHQRLAKRHPHAVINVIVTAIGGENSQQGQARFARDVMSLRPDVLLIDYALNDRGIGLPVAERAWSKMIEQAKAAGSLVILLTPTPDLGANLASPTDPLTQHAEQIRGLAKRFKVSLADPYATFAKLAAEGKPLAPYMSQGNHPNRAGHEIVADRLMEIFHP